MLGPVQLNRLMRRYGRAALALAAVLAAVALLATVRTAMTTGHEHHATGHDAVVVCVAVGGCALAVIGAAIAVPALVRHPLWRLAAPRTPGQRFVATPTAVFARAGPSPPLLQSFRL